MSKKRTISFIVGFLTIAALAACGANDAAPSSEVQQTPAAEATAAPTETPAPTPEASATEGRLRPTVDREGYDISLPDEINTIISIGPSNTELLVALGYGGNIVSTDTFSWDVEGIAEDIAVLDMMALDAEFIINLQPDIIIVTGMTRVGGEDPLTAVSNSGISVVYMPTSAGISEIIEDIRFIASVLGTDEAYEAAESIIAHMEQEIDYVRNIARNITETRTVYFEISPAPWMYSFGRGVFLHELLEIIGAENIFEDQEGWLLVSDEILLSSNPDVILTNVDFIDDPVEEILQRPGFDAVSAVQNGYVFVIDSAASSRANHNIVIALRQMAEAIYPEYFK